MRRFRNSLRSAYMFKTVQYYGESASFLRQLKLKKITLTNLRPPPPAQD